MVKYYVCFLYRTIKLFLDIGGESDSERSGWPRMVHTPQIFNAVRSRIHQNPVSNQIMAQKMDIVPLTNKTWDRGFQATKRAMPYCFNKKIENKSSHLLFYGKCLTKNPLYRWKNFTVEETFNKQNDRVYAWSSKEACKLVPRIERVRYPASGMVWWDGVTSLHSCVRALKQHWDIVSGTFQQL